MQQLLIVFQPVLQWLKQSLTSLIVFNLLCRAWSSPWSFVHGSRNIFRVIEHSPWEFLLVSFTQSPDIKQSEFWRYLWSMTLYCRLFFKWKQSSKQFILYCVKFYEIEVKTVTEASEGRWSHGHELNFLTIECLKCRIEYNVMVTQAPSTAYSTVKCVELFNRWIEREYNTDEHTKATYLYVCFCCDKLLKYSETAIATPEILTNLS